MSNFRIASFYPDKSMVGRNDGGPLYHTYNLRKIFGTQNVAHVFQQDPVVGKFDLYYWVDHGEDAFGWTDFVCPKPNIYIPSDTHLGYDYRLKKAREFDWVFCNQHQAQKDFIAAGIPEDRCFWLPHAFDPMAYGKGTFNSKTNTWMDTHVEKRYDVCFVGNLNDLNRVTHIDRLFKEIGDKIYWGTERFHEAAEIFNQSKIVFNVSARGELNMRHFEALGSGAFLLSDNIPESENVFKEGVHFAGYSNMAEMIEKARYYLEHDEERERIAHAGHIEAHQKHTYLHRVISVLKTANIQFDEESAIKQLPQVFPVELVGAVS